MRLIKYPCNYCTKRVKRTSKYRLGKYNLILLSFICRVKLILSQICYTYCSKHCYVGKQTILELISRAAFKTKPLWNYSTLKFLLVCLNPESIQANTSVSDLYKIAKTKLIKHVKVTTMYLSVMRLGKLTFLPVWIIANYCKLKF